MRDRMWRKGSRRFDRGGRNECLFLWRCVNEVAGGNDDGDNDDGDNDGG